jgi:phenylalanyl-tRNA synthetase beta chain
MKISISWLRDFLPITGDERQLARELTMAGLNVEGMQGDVLEVEFTTNRPDAMNHYGTAREVSAIRDIDLRPITPKLPNANAEPPFPIIIEDPQGCARYTGRVLRNVKIGPSTAHIVQRLESVEQRSINNAADATNYVLWELGHPTHVFDLDLLEGGKIIVRRARQGETLKTLDGVERKLHPEDVVIADANKPVALAGVMGGEDTKVTERTRNILIESAWFDPTAIRKTAKRHGMHTDASHRFERGADWGDCQLAANRVAELILESGGGSESDLGPETDTIARNVGNAPITLRHSEVLRHLGKEIPDAEITRILRRLGFTVTASMPAATATINTAPATGVGGTHTAVAEEPDAYTVKVPTWRLDIEREIDLIEEIARIHGYDSFPNTLPSFAGGVIEQPYAAKDTRIRADLLALGYNEAMSPTFIAREDATRFANSEPVLIANPLSEEAATMRTSLVPGMLDMLARNLNYGTADARLFEAGNVYEKIGSGTDEHKRITIGATGRAQTAGLHGAQPRAYSFFDLKGDVEEVLGAFSHRALYFDTNTAAYFHPGRAARAVMDGSTVAQLGQIHPDVAQARKLKQDVYIAEIYLERLYKAALRSPDYKPIPRFPAVSRDFSFVFSNDISFERIRNAVQALRIGEMTKFAPVEIFRGGSVPQGKYSILLRAEFQSRERTLRDEEVATWSQQIIKAMEAIGGTLRA